MISNLSNTLINVFFSLATTFIKIVLAPVDILISRFLPNVNQMIIYVNDFFDYALSSIGWVIDSLAIPKYCLEIIITYYLLKYSIYFSVYLIKIVLRWFK